MDDAAFAKITKAACNHCRFKRSVPGENNEQEILEPLMKKNSKIQ